MIDAVPSLIAATGLGTEELVRYLRRTGWTLRPSRVEGIEIAAKLLPNADAPVEFIVPTVPGFQDERRRIADALRTIAAVEGRTETDIADDIRAYVDRPDPAIPDGHGIVVRIAAGLARLIASIAPRS